MTAEVAAWIAALAAVIAVVIAVAALIGQRHGDDRLAALETTQGALLEIERARDEKEAAERAARREAEAQADREAAQQLLAADIDVLPRLPRPGEQRTIRVLNR